jgi:glycosyltransferase involved in cell wall biosynthesis
VGGSRPEEGGVGEAAGPARAATVEALAAALGSGGPRRVAMLAWRDLDDPEAGGSELHAHEIARRWAAAGIRVVMRTSSVRGTAEAVSRDGYEAIRRAGRYAVFAAAPLDVVVGRLGPLDGLVEIWNGMPFFAPLWSPAPHVVFLHHVHAEMWSMVLPPLLARAGRAVESRLAPRAYRRSHVVTLSASSRDEIVEMLGLPAPRVHVVAPGIDARYSPGGRRADHPLVVSVGRLVPVKRLDMLVAAAGRLRHRHPGLEVVIAGEGYERPALEAAVRAAGLGDVVRLPGRLSSAELVDLYRRAWVLVSTSAREGWGMTISEAGACGTPAVATDIAGHRDAVEHGVSGLLAPDFDGLVDALDRVLSDTVLRHRLGRGARRCAERLSWDTTASATLAVLAEAREEWRAERRRAPSGPRA